MLQGLDVVIYEGWEVAASPSTAWATRFRLIVDAATFLPRALEVDADGPRGLRRLSARRDPKGHWWVNGKRQLDLDACLDADVAATPLTNTPTIRRLALSPGDSASAVVAWVDIPSLSMEAVEQAYERLDDTHRGPRFMFRTVSGESFEITTEDDGLVRGYEGLFRRISRR